MGGVTGPAARTAPLPVVRLDASGGTAAAIIAEDEHDGPVQAGIARRGASGTWHALLYRAYPAGRLPGSVTAPSLDALTGTLSDRIAKAGRWWSRGSSGAGAASHACQR